MFAISIEKWDHVDTLLAMLLIAYDGPSARQKDR